MRVSCLRRLLFTIPLVGVFGQTPVLQMNVVYVCTDGQSFKVFSCTGVGDTAAATFRTLQKWPGVPARSGFAQAAQRRSDPGEVPCADGG